MNTNIPQEFVDIANRHYHLARTGIESGTPITVLYIANEYTLAVCGSSDKLAEHVWMFAIGSEITAQTYFKHNPPTEAEIEEAIMMVEDEVMPIKKHLIRNAQLITFDTKIREIALLTETIEKEHEHILTIGNMEGVFNRLAAIITGRPASTDILPTSISFAASLLILREFMHHLGYTTITIREQ